MTEEKRAVKMPNNIILEDRKKLTVTGVSDMDSFDDQSVVIYTDLGELSVRGNGLHIGKLNTETGELTVTGNIYGMAYTDDGDKKSGIFGRLFR